jgi:hypothetical protein
MIKPFKDVRIFPQASAAKAFWSSHSGEGGWRGRVRVSAAGDLR